MSVSCVFAILFVIIMYSILTRSSKGPYHHKKVLLFFPKKNIIKKIVTCSYQNRKNEREISMEDNYNGLNTNNDQADSGQINSGNMPQFDYTPQDQQPDQTPQFDYTPQDQQPNQTQQFDYTPQGYGQPNSQMGNPQQFDYSRPGYGQPNNTPQSDYNQVYNQPNYNQPNYNQPNYNQQGYNPQYNYSQSNYPNYSGGYQPEGGKGSDTKSVLSLVFGIAGLVLCSCGGGVIFGIVGIIMAILSKGDNDGKMNGLAVAGMILSIISFVVGLATLALVIFAIIGDPSFLESL